MTNFCYIQDSIVNMREHPLDHSKVISQAIFSEKILVDQTKKGWSFVSTPDSYAGWIPSCSFVIRNDPYPANVQISRLAAHLYALKDIEFGPFQTLPYGSRLQAIDSEDMRWIKVILPNGQEGYIQKGDVAPQQALHSKKDLAAFSRQFLGLPYTWGGRSSFGYDCSGFVQMLYEQIGISLPRDSNQQAIDARFASIDLNLLEPGDLIFFGNADQRIKHVGMHLEKGSFIHATSRENQPWIRISHLSNFEWSGHSDAIYPFRQGRGLVK